MRSREPAAVRAEIALVDRQLARLPQGSPERAHALRAGADLHAELARVARGIDADYDIPESEVARTEAIRLYGYIEHEYPNDPGWDDAVYFAGLELELQGEAYAAATKYMTLLQSKPTSDYSALAHFGIGEAMSLWWMRKNRFAASHFRAIVNEFPTDPLVPFALLRLGELADIERERAEADSYYDRLEREYPGTEAARRAVLARSRRWRDSSAVDGGADSDAGTNAP